VRIFVSYTLRDGELSLLLLHRLSRLLTRFGHTYVDALHNSSPRPQAHVEAMLSQANVVVACLTTGFLESEWVRHELRLAATYCIPVVTIPRHSLSRARLECGLTSNLSLNSPTVMRTTSLTAHESLLEILPGDTLNRTSL
jgi:hypothetical protein